MVVIGLLVILALGAVVLSPRERVLRGRRGAVGARAASLFMNVAAGGGGPAIVLYAVITDWEHRRFVATFQFYSIFVNLTSLLAKGGLPNVSAVALVVSASRWSSVSPVDRRSRAGSTPPWPDTPRSVWPWPGPCSPWSRECSPGDARRPRLDPSAAGYPISAAARDHRTEDGNDARRRRGRATRRGVGCPAGGGGRGGGSP